mgnify:CR=1 FL=1
MAYWGLFSWLPSVVAQARGLYNSNAGFTGQNTTYEVSVAASMPLYDRGQRYATATLLLEKYKDQHPDAYRGKALSLIQLRRFREALPATQAAKAIYSAGTSDFGSADAATTMV